LTSEPALAGARLAPLDIAPHGCFACGTLNEHGLFLELHVEVDRSWTEVSLPARFQGWDGIAHGGIVATILDEVMAWSLAATDDWGVTARMQVEYRQPVPLHRAIRADGWTTDRRRRVVTTAAELTHPSRGLVLARATGTYVTVDEQRKQELRARYVRPISPTPHSALEDTGGPEGRA